MRGLLNIRFAAALIACAGAVAAIAPAPVAALGSYSPYNETPAAALARYVRALASDPRDFDALIGAGRSALVLGDTQAAAGFFARADEVNPQSPLPQGGMGSVSVANGEAQAALAYFARAQQLGATAAMLGCNRGLAYDLLGQQAKAQADYHAAINGPDGDEVRRRLALSLAISGNKPAALAELSPLMAKGDAGAARTRAFVLALSGDSNGAMVAIDAAMPGSWTRVAPFLQRLPSLAAGEKAAAVNLGIFPDATGPAYAAAVPSYGLPTTAGVAGSVNTDRLSGIDALLRAPTPQPQQAVAQPPAWQPTQPTQVAYASPSMPATVSHMPAARPAPRPAATVQQRKLWLQLASSHDAGALRGQFRRIKTHYPDLFDGITGYVAASGDRTRLLVGPFRGTSDAEIFAKDLKTVGVDAFKWSNSPSDRIVPVAAE